MNTGYDARMKTFTMFGFTQEPESILKHRLADRLDIVPKMLDFGNAGRFFFHTSYGDVAETEQAMALKLGFTRTPTKSPLSARQLLEQEILTPQAVDHTSFRGNALVICFSKTDPRFVAFMNLLSVPQLYYWVSGNELIASDHLKCLLAMLDRVELNEDIIPFHLVLRHAPGPMTYFKNVHRLFPGQFLKWQAGNLDVRCVQDLRFADNDLRFERANLQAMSALDQEFNDVIGAYISDIQKSGASLGNLLSGGVDSSVVQLVINEQLSSKPAKSFSFVPVETPSFQREVDYAEHASKVLETEHTFVEFKPEDYPGLVVRAVETLGYPVLSEVEPGKLALAEFLSDQRSDLRFFFVGQAGDSLFGSGIAPKLKVLDLVRQVPGSALLLKVTGNLLQPVTARSEVLLKGAELLFNTNNPHFFAAPMNTAAVGAENINGARRCFGDETIRQVLAYRRELETQYLNGANYTEKLQVMMLLSQAYEVEVQYNQLFLAHNKEQICPYLDDDLIRISFAFRPEIRYVKGLCTKYLLKDMLEQRGLSSIARRPKAGSVFTTDLYTWMRSGPLREMVRDIDRPGFLSKADFEQLIEKPDYFSWTLLTFDIFQKRILKLIQ